MADPLAGLHLLALAHQEGHHTARHAGRDRGGARGGLGSPLVPKALLALVQDLQDVGTPPNLHVVAPLTPGHNHLVGTALHKEAEGAGAGTDRVHPVETLAHVKQRTAALGRVHLNTPVPITFADHVSQSLIPLLSLSPRAPLA
jgi:hypothetical protein